MTRRAGLSTVVTALLATGAAQAVPMAPLAPPTGNLLHHVQAREADVFFDGRGNRILLDRATGEIISIRPARPFEQEGEPIQRIRPMRQRGVQPDVQPGPSGDYYDPESGGFPEAPPQAFPEPPIEAETPRTPAQPNRPAVAERKPAIERKPLAPKQSDTPEFRTPDTAQPAATEEPVEQATIEPQATLPAEQVDQGAGSVVETSPTAGEMSEMSPGSDVRENVAALQILLDRVGSSPGVIDGRFGSNVDRAIVAYRRLTGKSLKSTDTVGIQAALAETGGDPFMNYTLTAEDVAGPYVAAVPEDYSEKAKLERMSYTSVTEMLGERFHMDENFLKAFNPDANFARVGTVIRVANTGENITGKVARITADKANKQVLAYDAYNKLVAAYPATIGSSDTPSPTGTHAVSRIAFNPEYTYNPKVNFKQGENNEVLTIPPGPNGPVGSIWIALDKPTYGVHGTPEPSKIGKTESHGCVRLTNWDASELAKIVTAGVTVEFLE